jgi:hypothetical protein
MLLATVLDSVTVVDGSQPRNADNVNRGKSGGTASGSSLNTSDFATSDMFGALGGAFANVMGV